MTTTEEEQGKSLRDSPMHLGLGATTSSLSKITGMDWYEGYGKDTESDGDEGRLVSMYTFTESWNVWEMHPVGEECVICTQGEMVLWQEMKDGSIKKTRLKEGEYAINPKGVWHTSDCDAPCSAIFITPGRGTEHKPRVVDAEDKKE